MFCAKVLSAPRHTVGECIPKTLSKVYSTPIASSLSQMPLLTGARVSKLPTVICT